jgi:uroporphyrinogen decarboxylase
MTPKQRFLTAMTNGKPDRVPCTPDFSNMIPCRLTGKPFWDIYLHQDPPLWRAYLHAAKYFGIDPWFQYACLDFDGPVDRDVQWQHEILSRTDERIVRRSVARTPEGDLCGEDTFYRADPPTPTRKVITDLASQRKQLPYIYRMPAGYRTDAARAMKAELTATFGEEVAFGTAVGFTGFQGWFYLFEGGAETLAYLAYDHPELLDELAAWQEKVLLRQVEMIIESKLFDYLLLGGSGAVTLCSPSLFDRYAFPSIQKVTRLCRQAGLPTMLHCCGKEMHLLRRCAEESDLNCANPLEVPPMGDCTLAEAKRLFGHKLSLMGNLHTTDLMLRGSVEQVKAAARQAIADAGQGGGFLLSTGDQCGRDTPDQNIFAMVEVCKTYGRYGG